MPMNCTFLTFAWSPDIQKVHWDTTKSALLVCPLTARNAFCSTLAVFKRCQVVFENCKITANSDGVLQNVFVLLVRNRSSPIITFCDDIIIPPFSFFCVQLSHYSHLFISRVSLIGWVVLAHLMGKHISECVEINRRSDFEVRN